MVESDRASRWWRPPVAGRAGAVKRSGGKYYLKVNNSRGWKLASYNTLNVV